MRLICGLKPIASRTKRLDIGFALVGAPVLDDALYDQKVIIRRMRVHRKGAFINPDEHGRWASARISPEDCDRRVVGSIKLCIFECDDDHLLGAIGLGTHGRAGSANKRQQHDGKLSNTHRYLHYFVVAKTSMLALLGRELLGAPLRASPSAGRFPY